MWRESRKSPTPTEVTEVPPEHWFHDAPEQLNTFNDLFEITGEAKPWGGNLPFSCKADTTPMAQGGIKHNDESAIHRHAKGKM